MVLKAMAAGQEADPEEFHEAVTARLSRTEMRALAARIPADQKEIFYLVAEQIATEGGLTAPEAVALQELREALGLAAEETADNPAQPDASLTAVEQEVHQIAVRYSRLAAVLAFLPLPYIDSVGIISLQTRMVSKIAEAYEFEMQAKQFVSLLIEKVGLGCGLALLGEELLHLLPIVGWVISAGLIFEVTYAIATVTRRYIELDGNMGSEDLKEAYQEAYGKAKKDFAAAKRKTFETKDKLFRRVKQYRRELTTLMK